MPDLLEFNRKPISLIPIPIISTTRGILLLAESLAGMDIQALMHFEHPFEIGKIPLGDLVLPSVRWRLRRLTLVDDEPTRFLIREFILSAWNAVVESTGCLSAPDRRLSFFSTVKPPPSLPSTGWRSDEMCGLSPMK